MPILRREEVDGELKVTIRYMRPGWQQWLGADETCEHSMILDVLGRELYEACDGKQNVKKMVERFAAAHSISVAEAELAVTTYLRTLLKKGLIVMAIRKQDL